MLRAWHWMCPSVRKKKLAHGSLDVRRPNPRSTGYLLWMSTFAPLLRRSPAPMVDCLLSAQRNVKAQICFTNWASRPAIFFEHLCQGVLSTSTSRRLAGGSDRIVEVPCVTRSRPLWLAWQVLQAMGQLYSRERNGVLSRLLPLRATC